MNEISVIIRVKNEERWIGHAIQSVIENLPGSEIIIIDNNSTDNCIQIAKYFLKDPKLKYTDKLNFISTKEGRKELVISLRDEIKKGVKKERYLSKEDAILLNQFINKIQKELQESQN